MTLGDESLSGVEENKRVDKKEKNDRYATRRALYALACVVGTGLALSSMEFRAEEAQAFQFERPIDAKKAVCDLLADDDLLRSLSDPRASDMPRQSRSSDDCGRELLAAATDREFEERLRGIVVGYPIEAMIPSIVKYDRKVAALLIGIAKKESDWGKRVPLDAAGDDCFNYWGFKGAGERGIAMGHGCFGSPEEAVMRVGDRIVELSSSRTTEPSRMIVWKCGSSCQGHSPESVAKWISDVKIYYDRIAKS